MKKIFVLLYTKENINFAHSFLIIAIVYELVNRTNY